MTYISFLLNKSYLKPLISCAFILYDEARKLNGRETEIHPVVPNHASYSST